MIRDATLADSAAIADIYNYYILNTVVTFEEEVVSAAEMKERMAGVQTKYPWLVYEENNIVVGYAYGSAWKVRAAYRHAAEISVYLDVSHTGRGIGAQLYAALLERMKALQLHAVIGGIALPNAASIRLHETLGFRKVAHFTEVGRKFDRWVDVAYWELVL